MKKPLIVGLTFVALVVGGIAALPHLLPFTLSHYRSDIRFSVPRKSKTLFLTIDDVPSQNTAEILRVLKKYDVPATFFVMADRVTSRSQLEEIVGAGQSLGNHLKTTRACSKLPLAEFKSDFDACSVLLERCAKPGFFRPASDFGTEAQMEYARSKGYQPVMGTVFPLDHWISNPTWLVAISRWLSVSGGILILHDGPVRGLTTSQVLDRLIPQLVAAGFVFGRLEKEFNPSSGEPGPGP